MAKQGEIRELVKEFMGQKWYERNEEERDKLFSAISALLTKEMEKMKKKETETCTKCGGLGRVPNNPHIISQTCDRCNGGKIIARLDYGYGNRKVEVCQDIVKRECGGGDGNLY